MNPVVLAAVALSLVAFGAVASTSLSAQQSTSSASTQKIAQERDRLLEQTNAYISFVAPSGSNTKATIKNTGTSTITIDHCLALAPSTGNLKPTATTIRVNQVVNTGTNYNVTLTGTVAADNIKCMTSKGTVLPVKLDGAASISAPNSSVTDDLAIYSITAKVTLGTQTFVSNAAFRPTGTPVPNYNSAPPGSLIWSVPVVSQVTVTQVLRYDTSGSPVDISSGLTGSYAANSQIQVPIAGLTSKVVIKYTNAAGTPQSANIYPQTIAKMQGSSTVTGTATNTLAAMCENVMNSACQFPYMGAQNSFAAGMSFSNYACCTNPTTVSTYYASYPGYPAGTYSNLDVLSSRNYVSWWNGFTATTLPQSDQVFSFPAPSPSFTVSFSYSRDASVNGYSSGQNAVATTFTAVNTSTGLSQGNILPGSITINKNCGFICFNGSEHRDGNYQFRIEGVQTGQQIQVRVSHGVSESLSNPVCQFYSGFGFICDTSSQSASGSTTLTLSP